MIRIGNRLYAYASLVYLERVTPTSYNAKFLGEPLITGLTKPLIDEILVFYGVEI